MTMAANVASEVSDAGIFVFRISAPIATITRSAVTAVIATPKTKSAN